MTDTPTKSIGIKFPNSNRPAETLTIEPGATVSNVLQTVGLTGGFTLIDPSNPDQKLQGSTNLYAVATDGDMYSAASIADAGYGAAA